MEDTELIQELTSQGLLTAEQLQKAEAEATKRRVSLAQTILDLKLVSKEDFYGIIAQEKEIIYVDLDTYQPDANLKESIPEELCRAHIFFPIFKIKETLTIATPDPLNLMMLDQIGMKISLQVECVYSPEHEVLRAIDRYYGKKDSTQELIEKMGEVSLSQSGTGVSAEITAESPIAKLVDLIITQAARDRASDVHIEPEVDFLRVRFRIDGILHEIPSPPKHLELAIISRIKVLSGMDIAESRAPQDGHFQIDVDNRVIDLRVSSFPTVNGENIVMRLLDTGGVLAGLEKMGFGKEALRKYEEVILSPYGIILSTGPTGSGKTTTLYSALMRINSVDRKIVTIEDPVEYRIGLIRQTQVNPRAGLTFANGLRSILRQDPDVIMVGEIRDLETAVIAIQAALTGHLVFSTLHTNDAASSITRLINMGVEPFLISASLAGVMAQRLIRLICEECKEAYEPSKSLAQRLGLRNKGKVQFFKGKGCGNCKGTGYKGRTGIFELMIMDDELREMVIQGSSALAIREKACEKGMKLLRQDGLEKVLAGLTTWEEVSRVTEERLDVKPSIEISTTLERVVTVPKEEPPVFETTKAEVRIKPVEVEEYQKKISNWLARKK
ncbi:MAG: Flp pilus assembly complex ATPase component TadA [Candidatus Omnitrophica bacterium]|nr:Flp pilus assembly complex ATPase component TadA [Candidatus Omnitrophota bacterium]MBU1933110.1 Flp pilus assembly complex ATPase component TadA [Candidatus Omnitrophota bacterium]